MHFCQRANKNAAVCDCLRSCGELVRLSPKCMPPIAAHTADGRYFLHKICRLQWWRTFKIFTFSPIGNPSLLCLHCLHRNVAHSCKYLLRKITTGSFPALLFHRDISCVLPHAPAPFLQFYILCSNSAWKFCPTSSEVLF